jgi:starch synthase
MHIHFVNENLGGHATMHRHIRAALACEPELEATFFDLPSRSFAARIAGAQLPGLGHLDLDLHLIRVRLAQSIVVRRHLSSLPTPPDVLHAYTQNTVLLSIGHMGRIPTIVSIDATNAQNAYRLPYRRPTRLTPASVAVTRAIERRVYRAARRVVAHSRWAADSILNYGIPAPRVEVIPFGISVPRLEAPARGNALPRIVFVGASMERKGGWRLVRIWKRFLADRSRLLLVTLERVQTDSRIEIRNDVRPGDGKLEQIFATSDVFAFPGEIDAFGYAMLEAMAAELPVVAPGQAAVPEIVADGVTGLVVPPGDDEAFAAALRRLVDDADGRREMGEAGRRRVLEKFDAGKTTASLVELMRETVP